MQDVDFGPPLGELFKSVKVATSDIPNELVRCLFFFSLLYVCCALTFDEKMAEVEVDYRGELSFKASTVLTMKNAAFSLTIIVRILRIAGKVHKMIF